MRRTSATVLSIAMALMIGGCGGPKPEVKGPKAAMATGPSGEALVQVKKARAVSKEAKKDFLAAFKEYEKARKTGLGAGNCDSVASEFAAVYRDHPKVAEAKFNEGVIYEECGSVNKAEKTYEELLRTHPNFGPALNNLGQIYFSRGNLAAAINYFNKAAGQKTSEAYSNLAVIQRNQALDGDVQLIKETVNNVHRALAVDSFNIEAYATLALVLYDHAKTKAQLEMARLICIQATKVDENYAPVYNTLGLILLKQKKVTPALAEFRKAVALNNDFLEAHMNIGAITLSFRDYKSAEEAFNKVLTLNPTKKVKFEALVGLGVAYRGQRRFDEAMAKYKEAEALDPANVDIAYNMGILVQDYMFDAGNPAKAIQNLQRAANLLQRYVSSGRRRGKVKDAERRLKNINELIPMLREQQQLMKEMQSGKKS